MTADVTRMDDENEFTDLFDEWLGVYIGPLTTEEALRAIDDHTPGLWITRLTDHEGQAVKRASGWSVYLVRSEEEAMVVIATNPTKSETGTGNPALFTDALVLCFSTTYDQTVAVEQFSGGLALRFGFGEYNGYTLEMIAHHGTWHLIESGDEAPGLGGFRAELAEPADEGGDPDR